MENYKLTSVSWQPSRLLLTVTLFLGLLVPVLAQVQPAHIPLSGEAADSLAIKDLIDAYGHDADRRNGQSTIAIHGDSATGETYCLAHHIFMDNGKRMLMIMGIRYYDIMVRLNGHWLFAKRKLNFHWVDRKP